MQSDYIENEVFVRLLSALMPANRLALETSLALGLRISDVLSLKTQSIKRRMSIREQKTGKIRKIYLPALLETQLLQQSGKIYVFEGRNSCLKHRSRSAVYKDIKRVARLYRVDGDKITANITPHSARKIYAVSQYRQTGSLDHVKQLLNHSDEGVTMLYALADVITDRKYNQQKKSTYSKS